MTEPLDVPAREQHRPSPNTFSSVRLDPQTLAALPFDEFVRVLIGTLNNLKGQRAAFYEALRPEQCQVGERRARLARDSGCHRPAAHRARRRDPRPPGPAKISARAKKGARELETSVTVEVKAGVQEVKLSLS